MALIDQTVTDRYALYCGDCCEVTPSLKAGSVHLSIHSPPFVGLYHYSSSERDLSNARSYAEFFEHYGYVVAELARLTMPGRIAAVHCMDVPKDGANLCGYKDFPGDIIELFERHGFEYTPRVCIWKEPLAVRLRTMSKALAHCQIVDDSTRTNVAAGDYLIAFRRAGENPVPVAHPTGLASYAGGRDVPPHLLKFRGYAGDQTKNKFSQWVWRNYASCFWDDVRIDRVLPYEKSREPDDEKHVHPLQLDIIERAVVLWSNPGETVLTPFMGVGSEVAGAVMNGRRGVGVELKAAFYRQAVANLARLATGDGKAPYTPPAQTDLYAGVED